ncbi:MAG: DJ-1/PfpI family protein [Solirubrobacterales bacterium]
MKIAALVFDDITALDLIGPLEVFGNIPGTEIVFVGASETVTAERTGLALGAPARFEDVAEADILIVPGGYGTRPLTKDQPTLDWIRAIDETTTWTTSVCTGALLLAAAGLLDGRPATTHWLAYDELRALGAEPTEQRVVFSDKYVTGAGVSAGIDMALELTRAIHGPELAQAIQLGIEYDPQPPFDSGAPSKADPAIVELLRTRAAPPHAEPDEGRSR